MKLVFHGGVAEGVGVVFREGLAEKLAKSLSEALAEGVGVVSREGLADDVGESNRESLAEGVAHRVGDMG